MKVKKAVSGGGPVVSHTESCSTKQVDCLFYRGPGGQGLLKEEERVGSMEMEFLKENMPSQRLLVRIRIASNAAGFEHLNNTM